MTETEELTQLIKQFRQTPDDEVLWAKIIAMKRRLGIEAEPPLTEDDYKHARYNEQAWPGLLRREAAKANDLAQWGKQEFYNTLAYQFEQIQELRAALNVVLKNLQIKHGR